MATSRGICWAIIPTLLGAALGPTAGRAEEAWGKEVNGLSSRLVLLEGSKVGEPVKVKLELKNGSKEDRTYDSQQATVNNSLEVKGPDNKSVPYTDLSYQTAGRSKALKPGQTVTIFENLDVAGQYLLDKPGAYTVQFRGRDALPASNVLTITLERGQLPVIAELYVRMRGAAPQDWLLSKTANALFISRVPTSLKRDITTVQVWFTKEKKSGYDDLKRGPQNLEYIGETRLGHAWLSADDGVKTHWPKYAADVRGVLREFAGAGGNAKDNR